MVSKENLIQRAKSSSNWKQLSKKIKKEDNANKKRKLEMTERKNKKRAKTIKDKKNINKTENQEIQLEKSQETNNKVIEDDSKSLSDSEEIKNTTDRDLKILDSIFEEENSKEAKKTNKGKSNEKTYSLVEGNNNAKKRIGKYLAIDCEMVGVGPEGKESVLARVSIVNYYGHVIMDKFVLPREKVTDYRTHVSGITKEILKDAEPFLQVQKEVADLLKDKIVVGHAIEHDFHALLLDHPFRLIRDTSLYKPFRKITNGRTPSLKKLSKIILGIDVQGGEHSSVEDAQATMLLYRKYRNEWENMIRKKKGKDERSILSVSSSNDLNE